VLFLLLGYRLLAWGLPRIKAGKAAAFSPGPVEVSEN
jgi:hypothetical protein